MESVRHAARKLYSSDRLALEVRRVKGHQVAAIPNRVVDVGQIPAGELALVRIGRSPFGLPDGFGRCATRKTEFALTNRHFAASSRIILFQDK